MKRPRLTKDRLRQRDAIIEDLQADELERLAGMRKLPERAKRVSRNVPSSPVSGCKHERRVKLMAVIVYADETTWRTVADEYPAIGQVQIRGDLVREDVDGVMVPVDPPELTEQPVVRPAVASDGRRMQCHGFSEEDLEAFREYWADEIKAGKVQILDAPPADWKPEGWQEAILDEEMLI